MQNNSYSVKGFLKEVKPTKTFDTFSVREFVVESEEKYPQPLAFELYDDKNGVLDSVPVGQAVTVFFSQRGRTHNGRVFVTNRAWKLEASAGGKVDTTPAAATTPATSTPAKKGQTAPQGDEAPF